MFRKKALESSRDQKYGSVVKLPFLSRDIATVISIVLVFIFFYSLSSVSFYKKIPGKINFKGGGGVTGETTVSCSDDGKTPACCRSLNYLKAEIDSSFNEIKVEATDVSRVARFYDKLVELSSCLEKNNFSYVSKDKEIVFDVARFSENVSSEAADFVVNVSVENKYNTEIEPGSLVKIFYRKDGGDEYLEGRVESDIRSDVVARSSVSETYNIISIQVSRKDYKNFFEGMVDKNNDSLSVLIYAEKNDLLGWIVEPLIKQINR